MFRSRFSTSLERRGPSDCAFLHEHDDYLPSFVVITTGTRSDIKVAWRMRFDLSKVLVMDRAVPANRNILKEQIIFFHSQAEPGDVYFFRHVEIWIEAKKEAVVFLTNNLQFGAMTIAAIYKDLKTCGRWSCS